MKKYPMETKLKAVRPWKIFFGQLKEEHLRHFTVASSVYALQAPNDLKELKHRIG